MKRRILMGVVTFLLIGTLTTGGALLAAVINLNQTIPITAQVLPANPHPYTRYVASFYATPQEKAAADYVTDGKGGRGDQEFIWDAIASIPEPGGDVKLSSGFFEFSGEPLTIPSFGGTKVVSLTGSGQWSTQILQATPNKDAIRIGDAVAFTQGMRLGGFYLGTVPGTGNGIVLHSVMRSLIEDIGINGVGRDGLVLEGCGLNHFDNIVVSVNFHVVPGSVSGFEAGIRLEPGANGGGYVYSTEGNTFTNPVIEGGKYGYYSTATNGMQTEGFNLILGGTFEGMSSYGIYAANCSGLQVINTHLEPGRGLSSVYLDHVVYSKLELGHFPSAEITGNSKAVVLGGRATTLAGGSGIVTVFSGSDVTFLPNFEGTVVRK